MFHLTLILFATILTLTQRQNRLKKPADHAEKPELGTHSKDATLRDKK